MDVPLRIPSKNARVQKTFFGWECGELRKIRRLKFIYSEKATKFCEIFRLLLTSVHTVKSKGKISQNFVAFSEYMNFNCQRQINWEIFSNCCDFLRKPELQITIYFGSLLYSPCLQLDLLTT